MTGALRVEYVTVAGGVLCFRHAPSGAVRHGTGVVVVPPVGWEEVASYRARRVWADTLAGAGHHVVRLDLPGTGDSGGGPGDADRLGGWADAVTAAVHRLRSEPSVVRVAVLGIGVGGLAAGLAVSRGAPVDDLVLWATPARGAAAVRRLRALGRLQSNQAALPAELDVPLPDGWLEVGGFVLSAELLGDLEALDLRAIDVSGLHRALLVGADGAAPDAALREHLEAGGVPVTETTGAGYAAMVDNPQRVEVPWTVVQLVDEWLRADETPSPHASQVVGSVGELELDADGPAGVRELPLWLPRPAGRLFGVLTLPAGPPDSAGVCAVLLNAGAVRRSGPNRMWAEAARRWAAQGVPTLRLDLPAIGDSDGDADRLHAAAAMYDASINDDVRAACDELVRQGVGVRFVVGGLCTGAYFAFQAALSDERVRAAVLLNPRTLVWDAELLPRRQARKLQSVLSAKQWRRMLRGDLPLATVRRSLLAQLRLVPGVVRQRLSRQAAGAEPAKAVIETALDDLTQAGVLTVIGFSGNEPLLRELRAQRLLGGTRWPVLVNATLPGDDHDLRPLAAQRSAHELLDQALAAALRSPAADLLHSSS